jgi:NAD(P)-dependent dehydrogenase (short-subunit alcohol dehydrogenase family)/acyl carrier protein
VHGIRSARSPEDTVDVVVATEDGEIVCEVTGLRFAAVEHVGAPAGPRNLVHEIVWRPLDGTGRADLDQVVIVGDAAGTGPLAAELAAAGLDCTEVGSPEDLTEAAFGRPGAVLVAPSAALAGERPEDAARRCAWTLVRTAQRLAAFTGSAEQRIWAVTSDVRGAVSEDSVAHGPLWGASRILAGEHPALHGGVLDLAAHVPCLGHRLVEVLQTAAGAEDIVSLTAGATEVARLAPMERAAEGSSLQCDPSGTYLVTGGLGALGLEVARWLVDRGARRLLLAGRRGLPPRAEWAGVADAALRRQIDAVLGLEALGVTVAAVALDVTDAAQVAATLDPSGHGMPPVRGIVHAAGVTRDAMLDNVDPAGLDAVLAPKADGAMVLHRLFPPGSLDFFVMFSSCGQFAHLTGQTSYAAANSFLDALAAHRNAGGHTSTVSLGWTAWQGVGMSESIGTTMLEANSRGLAAVTASEAFRAWAFADRFRTSYQAILRVLPTPPHQPRPPMFRELTVADIADGDGDTDQAFSVDWSDAAAAAAAVTADVREQVAAELNLDAADLELKRPLVELGVDSVLTVALRIRLQRRYRLDLPPTILWKCPTVAALTGHMIEALAPGGADGGA